MRLDEEFESFEEAMKEYEKKLIQDKEEVILLPNGG